MSANFGQRLVSPMDPPDRVRSKTRPEILALIDRQTDENIRLYAGQPREVISRRIETLDREWDIERLLETNASALAFTSLVLGLSRHRRWLLATAAVTGFLFQHAVSGWCPPVPLLRRLGVRTRSEIDREKFALKVLRGDFQEVSLQAEGNGVDHLLSAVRE